VIPGGSSSGSGVAVAAGLVPFALGTDTAGSGGVPAGLNNIVGLKPSLGAISTVGLVPACRTLDCPSVYALTVDDAWAALAVMAGPDIAAPYIRDRPIGWLFPMPPSLHWVPLKGQWGGSSATRFRLRKSTTRSNASDPSARLSKKSTSSRSTKPRGCCTNAS
jgi:allophanate hydrolase